MKLPKVTDLRFFCFAPVHASLCIWQTKMTWSPLFLMRTSCSALHWAGLWLLWPSRPHSWSRFWWITPILDQDWGLEGNRSHCQAKCKADQKALIRNKRLHAIFACQVSVLACTDAKQKNLKSVTFDSIILPFFDQTTKFVLKYQNGPYILKY